MSIAAEAERLQSGPILLATDFSADAERALARAALLAAASGRTLTLLSVVPQEALLPPWIGESVPQLASEEKLRRLVEDRLADAARRHRVRDGRLVVAFGKPWEMILDAAAREGVALIVLGARGERGDRSGVGSTAWRVMQGTRCPLLIVRLPVSSPYRRVLVALDFDQAAPMVLASALTFSLDSEIIVLHALGGRRLSLLTHAGTSLDPLDSDPGAALAEARSRLEAFLRDRAAGRRVELRVVATDPLAAARELVAAGCELIAFGAPRRHPWLGALLGSFALSQLTEDGGDLLLAHPAEPDAR